MSMPFVCRVAMQATLLETLAAQRRTVLTQHSSPAFTCLTVIGINALGMRVGQLASTAPSSGSVSLPVATAEAPRAGIKRAREGGSSDLTLTHVKKSRAAEALVPRVLTRGRPYIDLSWFFGNDPNGKQRKAIQQACASNAVVLFLGDCKTLASAGFVSTQTEKVKELLPGRAQVRSTWSTPQCSSLDRHKTTGTCLEVQRVSPGCSARAPLGSLADLNAHAAPKKRHATFHASNPFPTSWRTKLYLLFFLDTSSQGKGVQ